LKFLAGKESWYEDANGPHYHMHVEAIAVQLERLCKIMPDEMAEAVQNAFKWLTGCNDFEEAILNGDEERYMSNGGLVAPKKEKILRFDIMGCAPLCFIAKLCYLLRLLSFIARSCFYIVYILLCRLP
jgi:hypothetical protein